MPVPIFHIRLIGAPMLERFVEGQRVQSVPLPQNKTSSLLLYLALWQVAYGSSVDRNTVAGVLFNKKATNLNVEVKRLRDWLHERAGLEAEASEQTYVANVDNLKSGLLQLSDHCVIDYVKFREVLAEVRSAPSFRMLALLQRWCEFVQTQAFFAPQPYLNDSDDLVKQCRDAFERDREEAHRLLKASKVPFDPELPQHNAYFVGRSDPLRTLQTAFATQGAHVVVSQAISGMGGVGKTTLAVEYARASSMRYTYVFFVRAETQDTIRAKYEEIATWLGLLQTHPSFSDRPISEADSGTRTVQVVKDWLTCRQDYLLILDNVEDPSLLQAFLPTSPGGHVLITARSQSLGKHVGSPILLDCFSQDRARDFLVRRLGLHREAERTSAIPYLQRIAVLVGGLPLALALAADAILGSDRNIPGYVAKLEENISVLERVTRRETAEEEPFLRSLQATFLIPFGKLPPSARDLLRLLAFLAPEPVQEEWLLKHPTLLGTDLGGAIARHESLSQWLNHYGLCDCSHSAFQLHRLVHGLVRETLTPEEQTLWLRRAVAVLNACLPELTFEHRTLHAALIPHLRFVSDLLKTDPWDDERAARLLHWTARYQIAIADLDPAEEVCLRSHEIRKRIHPSGAPEILFSLSLLAECYSRRSNRTMFGMYAEKAWEEAKRSLPSEHPHWATIYEYMCFWRMLQNEYEAAEGFGQLALERAQGDKVSAQWCNLGVLQIKRGRWAKARDAFEQALQFTETRPGFENESTAMTLASLSEIYARLGRFDLAQKSGEQALHILERLCGRSHPMYATALLYHSHCRALAGDSGKAEELARQAAAIRRAHHGENSADHVDTLLTLTSLVLQQERLEEAKQLLDRVHAIAEAEGSCFAANASEELLYREAQWRFLTGDYGQAEHGFLEVLARHQAHHVRIPPQAPDYLTWLGKCAKRLGNLTLARERFENALQLLQEHPTPSAGLIAFLQSNA